MGSLGKHSGIMIPPWLRSSLSNWLAFHRLTATTGRGFMPIRLGVLGG
jgi:hypothetical protein